MAPANRDHPEKTIAESVASGTSGNSSNSKSLDNEPQEAADEPLDTRQRLSIEVTTDAYADADDVEAKAQRAITTKQFPITDLEKGIVGWDSQDDSENPQNFAMGRKWGLLALMSAITFVSPLASSMFSPAVSYVAVDLGVANETILSLSVSIFLIGYAVSWLMVIS